MNTDKRIELTQVAQLADQIDYLEALFVDLDGAPESHRVIMAKLRTLGMLAAAYNKGGFCRAAVECLRLSEPYFCQWIAHREEPLNEKTVDSLVWNYLALGSYVDAQRAARLTADVVGYRLSDKPADDKIWERTDRIAETARIARWYNDQFQTLINTHEKHANNLALRVRRMKRSKTGASLGNEVVTPLPVVPQAVSA